ncbi:MAG: hypothetical protein HQL51_03570 [Magnetococcales bacterium]|nr:hypothetical protein [Magnetococcales bacterium]
MVLFVAGVALVALLPEGFWSGWGRSGSEASVPVGQAATAGGTGPLTPNAPRAAPPQQGMVPFEQAPQMRFDGKIQQLTELQQRDGQIHIWVHDVSGREVEISVAPNWFLAYMGCTLTHDIPVSGVGFRFDQQGGDPLIYAQRIRVNGKICRLRNDEGFALWSNRLR